MMGQGHCALTPHFGLWESIIVIDRYSRLVRIFSVDLQLRQYLWVICKGQPYRWYYCHQSKLLCVGYYSSNCVGVHRLWENLLQQLACLVTIERHQKYRRPILEHMTAGWDNCEGLIALQDISNKSTNGDVTKTRLVRLSGVQFWSCSLCMCQ
jgi:hypothetical protein